MSTTVLPGFVLGHQLGQHRMENMPLGERQRVRARFETLRHLEKKLRGETFFGYHDAMYCGQAGWLPQAKSQTYDRIAHLLLLEK
jgi:hypothetical protein